MFETLNNIHILKYDDGNKNSDNEWLNRDFRMPFLHTSTR
jgi:hypothetical protein